jgi:hypothetical protein
MPETRLEKSVFLLGLIVIAALGYLLVHSSRHQAPTKPAQRATTASVAHTTTAVTTAQATTAAVTTTAAPTEKGTAVALTLSASRGESWMEVRNGSPTGRILYSGVLTQGRTRSFHAARVWVLFGAAGNVDARVDGTSVRLPAGTYSALFDASGFRRARR